MVATLVRAIPDSDINAEITATRAAALPDAAALKDYRAYLLGKQLDPRTPAQRRMFPELNVHDFCDNVCRRVVLTPANRLTIARFDVADDYGKDAAAAIADFLADLGIKNHLARLVIAINVATLRDGDHALALRWVDGHGVRLTREGWWNGETGIWFAYGDDDLPRYVVREWVETGEGRQTRRRVVWWPDRFERYASEDGAAWDAVNDPGDPVIGGKPVPWTVPTRLGEPMRLDGEPIGIPAVHFANQLIPNDGAGATEGVRADSRYGRSLLAGGLLGIQDRINLVQFDYIATSSFTGTQMLWGTGVSPLMDPQTNKPVPYEIVPGTMITDGNGAARFGAFPAGSVEAHDRTIRMLKETAAQNTGLPYVTLAGDWPSGEALQRAEADLAEMVDKLGELLGPAYASAMHKATRLANVFGLAKLEERALIRTVFANAQRSNPLVVASSLEALARVEGVREALRDSGKQPGDIERIIGELREDARERATTAGDALGAMLDRGETE
jgi:hypothetical protein